MKTILLALVTALTAIALSNCVAPAASPRDGRAAGSEAGNALGAATHPSN